MLSSTVSTLSVARLSLSVRDYLQLVKLRLSAMVVVSGVVGYWLASTEVAPGALLAFTIGTFLVVAGANAFNQVLERGPDARMERTRNRPVPTGRIPVGEATAAAGAMSVVGIAALLLTGGWLTALLALLALGTYVLLYTPMKPRTAWATVPGAVAGAMPTLMGFSAASGELGPLAFCLFGILFMWQFPHTWAIAAVYRDDYERVGYRALPQGSAARFLTVSATLALVTLSLVPPALDLLGRVYLVGALALGVLFLSAAFRFGDGTERRLAGSLLAVSLFYLPVMLALAAFNQTLF
ncbi:MAG TPA: heme o synthase [Vicinamibacteria bacterium]|nr:heme o synthase [Vicinamibacteria bacterium]